MPAAAKMKVPSSVSGPEAARIAYLGVTVGFPLSVPVVGPARPSSAPLQAVTTLNPYMLVMQALHVLQRPWRDREKFEPLRRVTSLRALAIMSHELLPSALRDAAGAISR